MGRACAGARSEKPVSRPQHITAVASQLPPAASLSAKENSVYSAQLSAVDSACGRTFRKYNSTLARNLTHDPCLTAHLSLTC